MEEDILIIIDVQKGFITEETKHIIPKLQEHLKKASYKKIIATKFSNYDGSPFERFLSWDGLKDKMSQEIAEEITAVKDVTILEKTTYSAVNGQLLKILKEENGGKLPEAVRVCGIDTDGCVLSTVYDLFDAGIRPVVLTQLCASTGGKECHEAGLRCIKRNIGKGYPVF